MPLLWIIVLLLGVINAALYSADRDSARSSETIDVSTIAHNLLVYRNALAEYAYENPGMNGVPADSALELPSWWHHMSGVNGYVQAGSSYTYYASPPNGLVAELAGLTESQAVGYVSNGQLISPTGNATGVTVPNVVPNGAALAYR